MTTTTRRSPAQRPPSAAVPRRESACSLLAAAALPHFYDLTGHRRLLDISDAHGCWSIAAAVQPSLRATVLALPTTANLTRARVATAGLTDRVAVTVIDPIGGTLPDGHDVILVADLVQALIPRPNQAPLTQLRVAAGHGARLLLVDPCVMGGAPPTHQRGPGHGGYSVEEIRGWLQRAGWRYFRQSLLAGRYSLLVAFAD
jgi:hypothetical protein